MVDGWIFDLVVPTARQGRRCQGVWRLDPLRRRVLGLAAIAGAWAAGGLAAVPTISASRHATLSSHSLRAGDGVATARLVGRAGPGMPF
jgi:hypothetical protein